MPSLPRTTGLQAFLTFLLPRSLQTRAPPVVSAAKKRITNHELIGHWSLVARCNFTPTSLRCSTRVQWSSRWQEERPLPFALIRVRHKLLFSINVLNRKEKSNAVSPVLDRSFKHADLPQCTTFWPKCVKNLIFNRWMRLDVVSREDKIIFKNMRRDNLSFSGIYERNISYVLYGKQVNQHCCSLRFFFALVTWRYL